MFYFGGYTLDVARNLLSSDGREIALRPKAFAVLAYLLKHSDRLVPREELIEAVWCDVVVADEALTHCVSELRRALDDRDQKIIRTVARRGYRVAVEVTWPGKVAAASRPDGAAMAERVAASEFGACVAVLPFVTLSGRGPQIASLADEVAEDIITELSRFTELSVVARAWSWEFKGNSLPAREIGRSLGARYLVGGSVRRVGDSVRIVVQLIDARNGKQRWAERFDCSGGASFSTHDEVVCAIVTTLAAHVRKSETETTWLDGSAPRSAYDFYVRGAAAYGAHVLDPVGTPIDEIRGFMERSLSALDGGTISARANALLARTWVRTYWDPLDHDYLNPAGIERSFEFARRAVLADANLPIAHFQLGLALLFKKRQDEALAEIHRALSLNPNDRDWQYGFGLLLAGERAKAIEVIEGDVGRDPFAWPIPYLYLGQALYMDESYADALPALRRCARQVSGAGLCIISSFLAATYAQLGRRNEAMSAFQDARRSCAGISAAKMIRALPYVDAHDVDHLNDGLRKAGFPT